MEIKFYDMGKKQSFTTSDYKVREKNGRYYAVAKSPHSGNEFWKAVSKETGKKLMGDG